MTNVGRMNIDVTATTGKFDAAMAGVRGQLRSVGRVGSVAGSLGGRTSPIFGAMGGLAGLSGPLIGVTAALGALTAAMRNREQTVAKSKDVLDLALGERISVSQAKTLEGFGGQLGMDGAAVLNMLRAAASAKGQEAIRRYGEDGPGQAKQIAKDVSEGNYVRALYLLQRQSQALQGGQPLEIAKALGSSGRDFLRMPRAAVGIQAGGVGEFDYLQQAIRQQNFAAGNANWFMSAIEALMNFFGGSLGQEQNGQSIVYRLVDAQSGPGI